MVETALNTDKIQLAHSLVNSDRLVEAERYTDLAIAEGLGLCWLKRLQESAHPVEQKLQEYAKTTMLLHLLQERAMLEVQEAFAAASIPCIWLKGTALAYTVYPQAHLRIKNDLDCLVRPEDFPRALEILYNLAYYEPDYSLRIVARERLMHHSYLVHSKYPRLIFELHHRLLGLKGRNLMPSETLTRWFNHPLSFGKDLQTFQAEYHFLYICAHLFLQHGSAYIRLRDLYDLWLLQKQSLFNWDLLVGEAAALKWTFLLSYALQQVQAYFPCEIPESVFISLNSFDKQNELIAPILLKADADNRAETVFEYLAQFSIGEGLQKIFQMLFPSPAYMRERYAIPPRIPTLPYYLYRLFDQIRGLLLALIRRIQYYFSRKSSSGMNENHPSA